MQTHVGECYIALLQFNLYLIIILCFYSSLEPKIPNQPVVPRSENCKPDVTLHSSQRSADSFHEHSLRLKRSVAYNERNARERLGPLQAKRRVSCQIRAHLTYIYSIYIPIHIFLNIYIWRHWRCFRRINKWRGCNQSAVAVPRALLIAWCRCNCTWT